MTETASSSKPSEWLAIALMAVLIGVEFAFPNWSTSQLMAVAAAVVALGSLVAWRSLR